LACPGAPAEPLLPLDVAAAQRLGGTPTPAGRWSQQLYCSARRPAAGESALAQARNDSRAGGWSGPCPPHGHGPHRCFFRLHGLDAELDVGFRARGEEIEQALEGNVLATAELVGTFER
jgi:phosphatidylethanolamine-binding protein (PEBP) family uncharacterized protein